MQAVRNANPETDFAQQALIPLSDTGPDQPQFGAVPGLAFAGVGNRREYFGLFGSNARITIDAGGGTDLIEGGSQADYLVGGGDRDVVRGNQGDDVIIGDRTWDDNSTGNADTSSGTDNLQGGEGNDTIYAGGGSNYVDGGTENDLIFGGSGGEFLQGGAGDDIIYALGGNDVLWGGTPDYAGQLAAWRSYFGSVINFDFDGTNDTPSSGSGGGTPVGVTSLTGTGVDYLSGGEGNDTIYAQDGADFLVGGNGDDVLDGGAGGDAMDGGNGYDFLQYLSAAAGVTVDLQNSLLNTGDAAGDAYAGVEGIAGSSYNDSLYGDAGGNFLFGYGGTDYLFGRSGNDSLYGGEGDDQLIGGAGSDALDGGNGFDYAHYGDAQAAVVADLQVAAQNTGDAAGDSYTAIEGLIGSNFNDLLLGDAGNNFLLGGAGNDQLYGRDGYDALFGGAGNDTLYGGFNADTFVFGAFEGQDTIADFELNGGDTMLLSGLGVASFAQVQSLMSQVGANTVITFAGGNSITLLNINAGSLNAGDFTFA